MVCRGSPELTFMCCQRCSSPSVPFAFTLLCESSADSLSLFHPLSFTYFLTWILSGRKKEGKRVQVAKRRFVVGHLSLILNCISFNPLASFVLCVFVFLLPGRMKDVRVCSRLWVIAVIDFRNKF